MRVRYKRFVIAVGVVLGLAASGSFAVADLSVAPPQQQPTLSVAQPQPQPTVTVAPPAPQPTVTVAPPPPQPTVTVAPPAPQPTVTVAEPQPQPSSTAVQPAATASEVQPAAPAPVVQPAATASEVQPAAPAPVVQPAATASEVQPAATATDAAPSTPPASTTGTVTPTPVVPPSSSPLASTGANLANDAAGVNDARGTAKDSLKTLASRTGRALRTSGSAAVRSAAGRALPGLGRAARTAGRLGAAADGLGLAFDYQNQRSAGHSPVDSAGYAAARGTGGKIGAVIASGLCLPADGVSLGATAVGCLVVGDVGGNLVGGWAYGLARTLHNSGATHSNSNSQSSGPSGTTRVFVLPLF